jgi:catechol 2,3-dioxygenase-like lactoylglutathione lyase family enzyme
MPVSKVVGIDHISVRVRDYAKSKAFYAKLFTFLGFDDLDEYPGTIGWTNGKDPLLDCARPRAARPTGSAMSACTTMLSSCASRKDVDALQAFLEREKVRIVDPGRRALRRLLRVFFLDPDGLKLEGMKYGELTARKKRKRHGRRDDSCPKRGGGGWRGGPSWRVDSAVPRVGSG